MKKKPFPKQNILPHKPPVEPELPNVYSYNDTLTNDETVENDESASAEKSVDTATLSKAEMRILAKQKEKERKAAKKLAAKQKAEEKKKRKNAKVSKLSEQEQREMLAIAEISKQQKLTDRWFKLDNAALIYPSLNARVSTAVFRLSVLLKQKVEPLKLQEALNDVAPRFPTITSVMRTGLFWYYFDARTTPLTISKKETYATLPLDIRRKQPLVRVTYYDYEIAVEFFHSTCDGTGGLLFLNSLVGRYLTLCGAVIKDTTNCLNALDKPHAEELEDAFQRVYNKKAKKIGKERLAYHLTGTNLDGDAVVHRKIICSASELHAVAKKHDCTVTLFLAALILDALAKEKEFRCDNNPKPIILSIPLNIRRFYPSRTVRNFSSYFYATYQKTDSLDELIALLKQEWAEQNTKEYVDGMISYNCGMQRKLYMRLTPIWLKNIVLKIAYKILGDNLATTGLSNLGNVQAPEEFKQYVHRYEFAFGKNFSVPIGISVATFNDCMVINFSTIIRECMVEEFFVKSLTDFGIGAVLECTDVSGYTNGDKK